MGAERAAFRSAAAACLAAVWPPSLPYPPSAPWLAAVPGARRRLERVMRLAAPPPSERVSKKMDVPDLSTYSVWSQETFAYAAGGTATSRRDEVLSYIAKQLARAEPLGAGPEFSWGGGPNDGKAISTLETMTEYLTADIYVTIYVSHAYDRHVHVHYELVGGGLAPREDDPGPVTDPPDTPDPGGSPSGGTGSGGAGSSDTHVEHENPYAREGESEDRYDDPEAGDEPVSDDAKRVGEDVEHSNSDLGHDEGDGDFCDWLESLFGGGGNCVPPIIIWWIGVRWLTSGGATNRRELALAVDHSAWALTAAQRDYLSRASPIRPATNLGSSVSVRWW